LVEIVSKVINPLERALNLWKVVRLELADESATFFVQEPSNIPHSSFYPALDERGFTILFSYRGSNRAGQRRLRYRRDRLSPSAWLPDVVGAMRGDRCTHMPRDEMQSGNVRGTDDLCHFAPISIVTDGPVDRLVLSDIEFGLMTEESGKAGLGIKVDRKNAIASKRKVLGKMSRSGGFATTTFEIHHRDDLQRFSFSSER
jgi:hypothetical protein